MRLVNDEQDLHPPRTMTVTLKKRSGKYLDRLELPTDASVDLFKEIFYQKFHYYLERQRWTVDSASGTALKDGLLRDFGVGEGSVLFFKDLGVQISWRLVFVVEYIGPILIFPMLYFLPSYIYTWTHHPIGGGGKEWLEADFTQKRGITQMLALWLVLVHFVKRELETLFVHRFSNATMPIVRVPLNCGHYWILFGVLVGYFLYHPQYTPPWDELNHRPIIYAIAVAMLIFEALNFKTHIILRNLRPRGTRERGIPRGWGFDTVSCANYFWETLAWLSFSILTNTFTAYLFTLVAFAQMTEWALKRHASYRKDFPDYPKSRRAILPYIL